MVKEIWKDIPGFEGWYQVSNQGRVKRLARKSSPKERILCPGLQKTGYYGVGLCVGGVHKTRSVHRLVWEAFNGPIPNGMCVNHINEVKTDNRLENLNLLTLKDNLNWGTARQRSREKRAKMVGQYTLDGKLIRMWDSIEEAASELGFQQGNISKCCNGEKWRHTAHGYVWRFCSPE